MSNTKTPFRGKTLFDDAINIVDLVFNGPCQPGLLRSDAQIFSRFGSPGEIEFELPGVKKEDIKVTTEKSGPSLIVRVEAKRGSKQIKGMHVVRADEVNPKGIKSKYENGLLTVTLPKNKKENDYDKEIQIE